MAVFCLGPIIKERREELGLTQEDLADGICSAPTLSRIENGERMPTNSHFEILMQRLGYSAMSLDYFTDKKVFQIHETKIRLRYAYISKDFPLVKKYLDEFEALLDDPTNIDRQFLILYQTLLNPELYSNCEVLKRLEYAMKLTCPKYHSKYIPHVLSYEEIIILNNIAVCYDIEGEQEQAISILFMLKEYYDHNMISTDEALRTQPMILYNLSKILGLQGRYDECIEVCDFGIRIARSTHRCNAFVGTLFNRAWALLQRNRLGDNEMARQCLSQAISFSEVIDGGKETEILKSFYKENFSDSN